MPESSQGNPTAHHRLQPLTLGFPHAIEHLIKIWLHVHFGPHFALPRKDVRVVRHQALSGKLNGVILKEEAKGVSRWVVGCCHQLKLRHAQRARRDRSIHGRAADRFLQYSTSYL